MPTFGHYTAQGNTLFGPSPPASDLGAPRHSPAWFTLGNPPPFLPLTLFRLRIISLKRLLALLKNECQLAVPKNIPNGKL